jgi:hypothetical protein
MPKNWSACADDIDEEGSLQQYQSVLQKSNRH